jgi:hypothetical protein
VGPAILLCVPTVTSSASTFHGLRVARVRIAPLVAAMRAMIAAPRPFLREVRLASLHPPLDHDD